MHVHPSTRSAQPVFVNGVEGKQVQIKFTRKAYRKHSSRRAIEQPSECVVYRPQQQQAQQ